MYQESKLRVIEFRLKAVSQVRKFPFLSTGDKFIQKKNTNNGLVLLISRTVLLCQRIICFSFY